MFRSTLLAAAVLTCTLITAAYGATPRDVNTYHLFTPPQTKAAWETRAAFLRQQLLFGLGLYPMPEKTPLNPRITGTIEGPDYFVDSVAIETVPNFFLCGNLYRPKGKTGPFPGIANPHGHWKNGRLEVEADVPPAAPGDAKPAPGKANLVSIGVNLARQGFVVFAYDMVGYNDTNQIINHRKFADTQHSWSWNISIAGLQLWNSIRVVDFLESLPDVDGKRIGVTGASGGGTQTFLLSAVDPRIQAAVPVNMVSSFMQGGCLCENGPHMRLDTDNVEITSLMAPKPLLLISCTGDWTKNVPSVEFPALKKIYELYGAADKAAVAHFNYGHNYNIESREAMYAFFGKWLLKDTNKERFKEKPFELDVKAMRVWNEKNPRPTDAISETQLFENLVSYFSRQLESLWPNDAAGLADFQQKMRPALQHALGIVSDDAAAENVPAVTIRSEHAVLICGDSADAVSDVASKLKDSHVYSLVLPNFSDLPESEFGKFYPTYNRTNTAARAGKVANAIRHLKRMGCKKIDVAGLGTAGLPTLLARGVVACEGRTLIDVNAFDNGNEKSFATQLYSPGLRRAGDLRTAVLLIAPQPLYLHNGGSAFKFDEIKSLATRAGASLKCETKALSNGDIAKWLKD
ncbi:MAG TPA: acyl-CoA thioester hydrolase/BAAT C-terminal domain-containing protein [Planctomycetota bacterium]|nr:acyl-CoA thioester hydrolase/BAAT C-terminal domain-containing protein [Planctomycetota bacterium]